LIEAVHYGEYGVRAMTIFLKFLRGLWFTTFVLLPWVGLWLFTADHFFWGMACLVAWILELARRERAV